MVCGVFGCERLSPGKQPAAQPSVAELPLGQLSWTRLHLRSPDGGAELTFMWRLLKHECTNVSGIKASLDGVPMKLVSAGDPEWTGDARRPRGDCPSEMVFSAPIPALDGGETVVEVTDGKSTVGMRARQAFTPVVASPIPRGQVAVDQWMGITWTPAEDVDLAPLWVRFYPDKPAFPDRREKEWWPPGSSDAGPGHVEFVPYRPWRGAGDLEVRLLIQAPITSCSAHVCMVLPPQQLLYRSRVEVLPATP